MYVKQKHINYALVSLYLILLNNAIIQIFVFNGVFNFEILASDLLKVELTGFFDLLLLDLGGDGSESDAFTVMDATSTNPG